MPSYQIEVRFKREVKPPTVPPTYTTVKEEIEVDSSGIFKWVDGPLPLQAVERENLIRMIRGICDWLRGNGGTFIRVVEKE